MLRGRISEKDHQIESLRVEANRIVRKHTDLEAKVDKKVIVKKPAAIQTETLEDSLLIEQENDKLKREL